MERKALTKEQIEAAVNWWKDAIKHPRFDNGDDSEAGGMGMLLALLLAAKHEAPDTSVDKFGEELAKLLSDPREAHEWAVVGVDYGPDYLLSQAARAAGIDGSRFPWKTRMWFRDGGVQVATGNHTKTVELMKAEAPDAN